MDDKEVSGEAWVLGGRRDLHDTYALVLYGSCVCYRVVSLFCILGGFWAWVSGNGEFILFSCDEVVYVLVYG